MALNLGKQIGPLPAGAWVGVVGGGLAIAYFINRDQKNSSDESEDVQVGESGVGTGGGGFIYNPPQEATGPVIEKTNHQWGITATNHLVSLGNSPTEADNAVRKYLSSEILTVKETGMINIVVRQFGAPPEPLSPTEQPPPTNQPPPASTAKPSPVTGLGLRLRQVRNNTISWHHNGKNVTVFHVLAIDTRNGKYSTHIMNARAGGGDTVYTWTHKLIGGYTWASRPPYKYLVRPFNGTIPGDSRETPKHKHLI